MPARATAPVMPREPPTIRAVPKVPLCASGGAAEARQRFGGRIGWSEGRQARPMLVRNLVCTVTCPPCPLSAALRAISPAT